MSQSLLSLTNHKHLSLFQVMNLLAQEHDNQTVINLTRKWCLDSESEDIQRISMEFLYMNGYYKDLQVMIHKNEKSQNPLNREWRSEEHTSELQSRGHIVCRLLLEKKNKLKKYICKQNKHKY